MKKPLKQWVAEQALRHGVSVGAIWTRLYAGKMPWPPLERVNKRVVLVKVKENS